MPSSFEIVFLGTGTSAGIPIIGCKCEVCLSNNPKDNRLRSSLAIQSKNSSIVIDCGPDYRTQLLREGIDRMDATLITHSHKDHTAGFDDLRAFTSLHQCAMKVYTNQETQQALRQDFSYIFSAHKYPGIADIEFVEVHPSKDFQINEFLFTPVLVWHHKMPVLGFRFHRCAYITDIKTIDPLEKNKLYELEVLIVSCIHKAEHFSHFNLEEVLQFVEELKPKKTYLTHISHLMGLHDEVSLELPAHVSLSYDGLRINIS